MPVKSDNKAREDSLFSGRFQNIVRLAGMGKLIVSGPLRKNEKDYQGIFILNARTIDEATLLLDTDPAIRARGLDVGLFQ